MGEKGDKMGKIVEVDIKSLFPAPWNYKKDDEEKSEKLKTSIKYDGSAGVPAVRELSEGYEVIDGNHRLKALQELGWEKVTVENFGKINKAKAITIAHRRNTLWFESDIIALSSLLKNDVLSDISISQLYEVMPENKDELDALIKLTDFDWSKYEAGGKIEESEGFEKMEFLVSKSQKEVIIQALDKIITEEGFENNPQGMALEMMSADYLAG